MSRIRTIKPDFWKHEVLSSLPEATHMLAASLINYADDDGYFNANVGLIKAECCPLREPSVSIQDSLKHLSDIGYLKIGKTGDGRRYGQILSFKSHQRINRPTPSKIKELDICWEKSSIPHLFLSDDSHTEGNGREWEIEGNGTSLVDDEPSFEKESPADRIYAVYPHKVGKAAAIKAIDKAIALLHKRKQPDPENFLIASIRGWIEKRNRDIAAGRWVAEYPNPATWFNQGRYDDEGNFPKPKRVVHVLTQRELDEQNYRDFGSPPPEEWAPPDAPQGWVPCRN